MTKKDYELIATEIRLELMKYRENQELTGYIDKYKAIWELAHRLANEFKQANERFDRIKFFEACGIR
jgi:hypothetical protein